MMRLDFRQGIVKQQKDIHGDPLFLTVGPGGVNLVADNDELIVTMAHAREDYLHQESSTVNNAWPGPFTPGRDYHLYIDINIQTGVRTFNRSTVTPIISLGAPVNPAQDQNWFDLSTTTMKRWSGSAWNEVIRIFVGKLLNGSTLVQNEIGTTVGLNAAADAGFILFDDEQKPIKRYEKFNRGFFFTTESPIASQVARSANFKLEAGIHPALATENIARWTPVYYTGPNQIGVATSVLMKNCVGIASDDINVGDMGLFISNGFAQDPHWDWTQQTGTPLWISNTGTLTTSIPQTFSIQKVATIVDPNRIFVKVETLMKYL